MYTKKLEIAAFLKESIKTVGNEISLIFACHKASFFNRRVNRMKISKKMACCPISANFFKFVSMKSSIVWDITPCSLLKVNRRLGGTYLLNLQGQAKK
jgi:hypothetical protein